MPPTGGAAFRLAPENGNAAPTANRDGAVLRKNLKPLGSASTNKYEPHPGSSTGKKPGPRKKQPKQTVDDRFAGETPMQIALHREIERHYASDFAWDDRDNPGRRKATGQQNKRMRDVEAFIEHRNRARRLSDDDSGRDDLWIAAHHIYHYGCDPDRNIRAWAQEWGSALSDDELTELIERVCKRPLKWTADVLGKKFRATREEIALLSITTFGAFDDSTRKRKKRRGERKNGRRQTRRHAAGVKPQSASMARAEPWKAAGISRRTWYRRRKAETSASVSEPSASAYSVTVNLSFDGSVALNGTTLAPTRYSSNCWGPSGEVRFVPAEDAAPASPTAAIQTGDRSTAFDGQSLAWLAPPSTDIGSYLLSSGKTVFVEKEEDCFLCLKGTGKRPGSVDRGEQP